MKRRTPWPLDRLLAANRNALTVYATLRWLAGDVRKLGTTRARIADVCGLCDDTISKAMHELDAAGWVCVRYGRAGKLTWYRLTFPVAGFFPVAQKTRHSKHASSRKNTAQQSGRCGRKNTAHSLKRVGPVPVGPSRRSADGPTPGPVALPAPEQDFENAGPMRSIADIAAEVFGQKGNA